MSSTAGVRMNRIASETNDAGISVCMPTGSIRPDNGPDNSPMELSDFLIGTPPPQVNWLHYLPHDAQRSPIVPLPPRTQRSKRWLDVVVASIGLILASPLMLIVAVLVKLTSPGDVLFSQTRVGLNRRNRSPAERRSDSIEYPTGERRFESDRRSRSGYGRPFTLYKFRTMVVDAERNGAQFAVKNDPRVTRLGRFMRLTRIDEIPQLWNVLQGDMSLVGPRPERPEFIEELSRDIPNYIDRLQLKPGVTGIAQVVNGYDNNLDSFRRKVAYDLLYLRNCCLINDINILIRTVYVVVTGKGAM